MAPPSRYALGSALGVPSAVSRYSPSSCTPRTWAFMTLPPDTMPVAKSTITGPPSPAGNPNEYGLVGSLGSIPPCGATWRHRCRRPPPQMIENIPASAAVSE